MPDICQQCGAELPGDNLLDSGVCDSCLWAELADFRSTPGSMLRDFVEGHTITGELGRGGMGVVYRARQLCPQREVALKMLQPLDAGREDLRQRFQQEAHALAELDHPAILPLYEVGEADGLPYFTMKLASGGTLAQRLKIDGRWPAMKSAELISLIADGVHFAHGHGIIHRDIKPGNILFDEAGRPYLADFGLAKLADAVTFTQSAGIMGTPAYLAPEIATNGARSATIASDIYSLGAVLYELLAGRPPFVVDGLAALLRQITESEPQAPSTQNSQVPRDLEIICLKCLRKDPALRYSSAAEFAADLRRWMRGEPILARQITPLRRLGKWAQRRPALAGLSAALILLTLGSGIRLAVTNRQLNEALRTAQEERERADRRADFFVGSFADSLDGIGRFDLMNVALRDVLATETGTGEQARRRRANLRTRLGYALRYQGRTEESLDTLRSALAEARSLPSSDATALAIAKAGSELAVTRAELNPGGPEIRQLQELRNELAGHPRTGNDAVLEARAIASEALGVIALENAEKPELLLEYTREVSGLRRQRLELNKKEPARVFALVSALSQEAGALRGNPAAALLLNREALVLADQLCGQKHAAASWRRLRAALLMSGAQSLIDLRQAPTEEHGEKVLKELEDASGILDELAAADPLDWRSLQYSGAAHRHLADVHAMLGQAEKCRAELTEHLRITMKLSESQPDIRQCSLARIDANLKMVHFCIPPGKKFNEEDRPLVNRCLRDALETAKPLLVKRAHWIPDQEGFRRLCRMIAELRWAIQDVPEAEVVIQDGIATLEALPVKGVFQHSAQWNAAVLKFLMGKMLSQKNPQEALPLLTEAITTGTALLKEQNPSALAEFSYVRRALEASAWCCAVLGRHSEGLDCAEKALDLHYAHKGRAGPSTDWVLNVVEPVSRAAKDRQYAARARDLAKRALDELGPGLPDSGKRPPGLEKDLEMLRQTAATLP